MAERSKKRYYVERDQITQTASITYGKVGSIVIMQFFFWISTRSFVFLFVFFFLYPVQWTLSDARQVGQRPTDRSSLDEQETDGNGHIRVLRTDLGMSRRK